MGQSIEEIVARARRPEDTVSLCLRGDLIAQHKTLTRELTTASTVVPSLGERSAAARIAEQICDLERQMRDAETPFTLRAQDPRDWAPFFAGRPIQKKGEPDDEFGARWYAWVCGMVSHAAIDPVMTPEQVDSLVPCLSAEQWDELQNAAYVLNAGRVSVPFSEAASRLIVSTDATSRRPEQPESPSPDSSAPSPDESPRTSTTMPTGSSGRSPRPSRSTATRTARRS